MFLKTKPGAPRKTMRRHNAERPECRLCLEPLEERVTPSVYYDFDIMAKNGDLGTTGIASITSVNDNGNVAFQGSFSDGQGLFVSDGTSNSPLRNINPGFSHTSSHLFSPYVGINNSNQVVAIDSASTMYQLRTWDSTTLNAFSLLVTGGQAGSPFDAILSAPAVDGSNDVVFPALKGTSDSLNFHAAGSAQNSFTQVGATLPTPQALRPQLDNNGDVIVRDGNNANSPIMFFQRSGTTFTGITIADSTMNFTTLGQSPGVSADGTMVVFSGDRGSGPGVFARINTGQGFGSILTLAGENGGTGPHKAELGYDVNQNTAVPIYFSSFDTNNRVSAIHLATGGAGTVSAGDSYVVSFSGTPDQASPTTGKPRLFTNQDGIWTIRVNVDSALPGPGSLQFDKTSAIPVAQVNDTVFKAGGAQITSLVPGNLGAGNHDQAGNPRTPRAGDNQMVFWANTTAGTMIIRGTHYDSDQDGLLDHWETQGIDINQDGTIDLNLPAMGANPQKRDLFLEADWVNNRTSGVPTNWSDEPDAGTMQALVNMFAVAPALSNGIPAGITLHVDAGAGLDTSGNPFSINMGSGPLQGGDLIGQAGSGAHLDVIYFGLPNSINVPGVQTRSFDDIKSNFFGTADLESRFLAFHYVVFADFSGFVNDATGNPFTASLTGATSTTLTTSAAFPVDPSDAKGRPVNISGGEVVMITAGKGAGQIRTIQGGSNPANQLTIIQPWAIQPDSTSTFTVLLGSSGRAELAEPSAPTDLNSVPGNDLIVSLGGFAGDPGHGGGVNSNGWLSGPDDFNQWRTLAHELGHTLGLRHGGNDNNSQKGNNYLSLMSYSHQVIRSSPVSSYSGAGDPTFNDWANLKMDFAEYDLTLGNSFGAFLAHGSTTTTVEDPEMNDALFQELNQPLTAASIQVSAPLSTTAGKAFSITLTVIDANGNTVTSYTGTVHFMSTDAQAQVPADYKFTAADQGEHTFTNGVVLKTSGSQTVTAKDTVTTSVIGKVKLHVKPATATHLTVAAPSSATAGAAFMVTVTVLDAYGNVATGYRGSIHFTSTDTAAALPPDYTFTSTDKGVHTFSATFNTVGSQTLTVTDKAKPSIKGTATVTVNAAIDLAEGWPTLLERYWIDESMYDGSLRHHKLPGT
jgi:hypothetical protein